MFLFPFAQIVWAYCNAINRFIVLCSSEMVLLAFKKHQKIAILFNLDAPYKNWSTEELELRLHSEEMSSWISSQGPVVLELLTVPHSLFLSLLSAQS